MTAFDVLVDDLRCEQMDRTYRRQQADPADALGQLIGILAALLGEDAHRSRVEAGRKQRHGRKGHVMGTDAQKAVEALTQIRALCDEWKQRADRPWREGEYETASVLVNLAEEVRAVLDAVSVDATPTQRIDRDALDALVRSLGLPFLGGKDIISIEGYLHVPEVVDRILALVRPVEGVTLTPDEARLAHSCALGTLVAEDVDPEAVPDLRALAARLETSS